MDSDAMKNAQCQYEQKTTFRDKFKVVWDNLAQYNDMNTGNTKKTVGHSILWKKVGNKEFTAAKNEHYLRKSIEAYTKSIAFAPVGSKELSLAYANRSAVLSKARLYEDCLLDIERSLKAGYPDKLKTKLFLRQSLCFKALKPSSHIESENKLYKLSVASMDSDAIKNARCQYAQKTTFRDKFKAVWDNTAQYNDMNTGETKKTVGHSILWKKVGNKEFTAAKKENYLRKSIEAYTKSIAFAPVGSSELSLAYANRSAVLFKARLYKDCLLDIERSLKAGYPDKLKTKLFLRQSLCFRALKPNSELEPSISMANAMQWLPDLKMNNPKYDIIKEYPKMINDLKEPLMDSDDEENVQRQYSQMTTFKDKFEVAWDFRARYIDVNRDKINKTVGRSMIWREIGNKEYTSTKNKDCLRKSIEAYTKSIAFAPLGSSELSLAYANRSAVLFRARLYGDCLLDIERSLRAGYPDKLKTKLFLRQSLCFKALKSSSGLEPAMESECDDIKNAQRQFSQMITFKDKFEVVWDFTAPYSDINHDKINKTVGRSMIWREIGNKEYTTAEDKDYLRKSIEAYTKSIAFAPLGSKELSLAYAKRSAVLFKARLYEDCLLDIERSLKAGYPDELKTKLFLRQSLCFEALKRSSRLEASISMANAMQWLPDLKENNPKYDITKEYPKMINELKEPLMDPDTKKTIRQQYSQMTTFRGKFQVAWKLSGPGIIKNYHKIIKTVSESTYWKRTGNKEYTSAKNKDYLRKSIEAYTKSIACAPDRSRELSLAYANRSDLLFKARLYEDCLLDIEHSLKTDYPDKLKTQLYARQALCFEALKPSSYIERSVSMANATQWLPASMTGNRSTYNLSKEQHLEINLKWYGTGKTKKTVSHSILWKKVGNKEYTTAKKENYLRKSIEAYTKSIAFAPVGSKELSLAYAKRSAVLFKARLYEDCLLDIERSLKAGYPDKLKTKLFLRQSLCFKALKPSSELEPSISMASAMQWLPDLKMNNPKYDIIKEYPKMINDLKEPLMHPETKKNIRQEYSPKTTFRGKFEVAWKFSGPHIIENYDEIIKTVNQSIIWREIGNNEYTTAENKDFLRKSIVAYTKSIAHAPGGSQELSLAYANRSAALFKARLYEDCLLDIERALTSGYPDNLKTKLYVRQALCFKALKPGSHLEKDVSLALANHWLPSLIAGKNRTYDIAEEYTKMMEELKAPLMDADTKRIIRQEYSLTTTFRGKFEVAWKFSGPRIIENYHAIIKTVSKTMYWRNIGNKEFLTAKDKSYLRKSIKAYIRSIASAPIGSSELSLAYENRSAVLFGAGLYED
ncbi:hypothetical protein HCN44_007016 [Aphidius gifuensis]|uniref:Uncharacterized protein n=1 Tax=Aphidius gifuensis TaxID=684658 RepID=A0A835CTE6_APHGI|nr:hypothetical protein HCN44_007016 [Aphidius gifuensis]